MSSPTEEKKAPHYLIIVKGTLDEKWADWFNGMVMQTEGDKETRLIGPVTDQAALHGMLTKIRDLGLTIITVQRSDD